MHLFSLPFSDPFVCSFVHPFIHPSIHPSIHSFNAVSILQEFTEQKIFELFLPNVTRLNLRTRAPVSRISGNQSEAGGFTHWPQPICTRKLSNRNCNQFIVLGTRYVWPVCEVGGSKCWPIPKDRAQAVGPTGPKNKFE